VVSLAAGVAGLVPVLLSSGNRVNEVAVGLVVVAYAAVGAVVTVVRPDVRVGQLLLLGATTWGLGEAALALGLAGHQGRVDGVPEALTLAVLGTASRGFGWLVLVVVVPLLFPDGRLAWPGRRWPLVVAGTALTAFTLATLLAPTPLETRLAETRSPTGVPDAWAPVVDVLAVSALGLAFVALGAAVAGLVHRWRHGGDLERQQVLVFGSAFALPLLFLPVVATAWAAPWMFALVSLPLPVAIGFAVLQRRLYDVQLAVNRTLTYGVLSVLIAGLYAVVVGGVGALLQSRGADWLPWVAAAVVAISFAPLRAALQQGANRLTYGQWAQPAQVLADTGRRLADATDVPGLLRELADRLADGLALSYVEIVDSRGAVLARHGTPVDHEDAPLTAYGIEVGALRWGRRPLRDADRRLLADLAHQLGGVVHSAGLLDAVRDAQERLVLGREDERRRLRRDLHDGLGPALAGLALQVDTLRNLNARKPNAAGPISGSPNGAGPDPGDTEAALLRLRDGIRSTVLDVRRIVEGLRPPALDDLGLAGALDQLAGRMGGDLVVRVDVPPLPPLPAAVEVAAYRIVAEALTNVTRHGHASCATVTIRSERDGLKVSIADDGSGEVAPRDGGVGLGSMRERAEEIGGRFALEAVPGRGTQVTAVLPFTDTSAPLTDTGTSTK
jgi:signal transduction histidine kinase